MTCRQCDYRIPERLLGLERFACPQCGKVYVRRAEPGRSRGETDLAEVERTTQAVAQAPRSSARKSKLIAGVLTYFFGITGAHLFYLGSRKWGIIRAIAFVVSFLILLICQGVGMAFLPLLTQVAGGIFGPAGMVLFAANAAILTLVPVALGLGSGATLVFTIVGLVLSVALMVWSYVDLLRILLGGLRPANGAAYLCERENDSYLFAMSVGNLIALSLFTSGIYGLIWQYRLIRSVRMVCEEEDGALADFLLCVFVPFYSVYWYWKRGKAFVRSAQSYGYAAEDHTLVWMFFAFFGWSAVSHALMQDDINRIAWGTMPRLDS